MRKTCAWEVYGCLLHCVTLQSWLYREVAFITERLHTHVRRCGGRTVHEYVHAYREVVIIEDAYIDWVSAQPYILPAVITTLYVRMYVRMCVHWHSIHSSLPNNHSHCSLP